MRVKYNIDTMLICQIGYPLDHSCSPFVHNTMYGIANLNAICHSVEVKKGELPKFIEASRTLNMKGFGLTMPHKSDIVQFLDVCEESSRAFKSVNHVKIVDGKLHGIGLDGVGMGLAIQHDGVKIKDSVVLMLGAGAVAGPIAADLCQKGARKVIVTNRTQEKAKYIVDTLKQLYKVEAEYGPLTEDYLGKAARSANIVVQCTSLGMMGHDAQFESLEFIKELPKDAAVADVLYPTTKLLETAGGLGLKTINGMGMMLHQQFAMMEFMFGVKLPGYALDVAHEALELAIVFRNRRSRAHKKI
jgi:shikimate dehydrogenase